MYFTTVVVSEQVWTKSELLEATEGLILLIEEITHNSILFKLFEILNFIFNRLL